MDKMHPRSQNAGNTPYIPTSTLLPSYHKRARVQRKEQECDSDRSSKPAEALHRRGLPLIKPLELQVPGTWRESKSWQSSSACPSCHSAPNRRTPPKNQRWNCHKREEHDFLRKHDIQQHKVHVEEASMPGLTDDLQTRSTKRNVPVCTRR